VAAQIAAENRSMGSRILEMDLAEAAAGFAALGDEIRLRVMLMLADGERCVCELQREFDIAPSLLSYHLRVLRDAGLVESRRRGRWVDYRLAPGGPAALRSTLPTEPEA
jgi:ArsR family transcriptional regulator